MASRTNDSDGTIADINIVPLVDIVLVVLIIFMVTAPAMLKPSVEVQLPEASNSDASEPSLLRVSITADGRILINDQEADEAEAKSIATTEVNRNPEVQAILSADKDVAYGLVVLAMDWIKAAGVKHFAVTTDKKVTSRDF